MFQNTLWSVLVIIGVLTISETISYGDLFFRNLDDGCYEERRDEARKHTCRI